MTTLITVKSISEIEKDYIVGDYQCTGSQKTTISELAYRYNTSSRTIGRVLVERGLSTPVPRLKGEAYTVMKLLKAKGLTADTLEAALIKASQPAPTIQAVQTYLNQCSQEQLAQYFYASGLIKLAEITQKAHAKRKQQQAALFRPVAQTQEPFQFAAAH